MPRIVIHGLADCLKYVHINYVTNYLAEKLPDFRVKTTAYSAADWEIFIHDINQKNNWNYLHSPIIWRELGMREGEPHLIGGSSEFWEFCYEYYGIESGLTQEEKEDLTLKTLRDFINQEKEARMRRGRKLHRQVLISGAGHPMTSLLVCQLLQAVEMYKRDGLMIQLYESRGMNEELKAVLADAKGVAHNAGLEATRIVDSLDDGLRKCDFCIILDEVPRLENENLQSWLGRNKTAMSDLAAELNHSAPPTCRVVYATPGDTPSCFNATVLAQHAIDLPPCNIVVVTADLGYETLSTIAKMTRIPIRDIFVPPVWGFIGLNKFVDINNAGYRTKVFIPNKRVLKSVPGSTLSNGCYDWRNRTLRHLTHHMTSICLVVERKKAEVAKRTGRPSYFAKVKATVEMLRHWCFRLKNDPIISLGVLSDGTCDIPKGMYFSQMVCLRQGMWVPYAHFPKPNDQCVKLHDLYPLAIQCLKNLDIGRRFKPLWSMDEDELRAQKESLFTRKPGEKFGKLRAAFRNRKEYLERDAEILKDINEMVKKEMKERKIKLFKNKTVLSAVDVILGTAFETCLPLPTLSSTHVEFDNEVGVKEASQGGEEDDATTQEEEVEVEEEEDDEEDDEDEEDDD